MAIINVEGSGMVGVKGVARRLFGTLETTGVNVVLISQASSEHSITFATSMQHAETAKRAIEEEFHKEIKQVRCCSVSLMSIAWLMVRHFLTCLFSPLLESHFRH